MKLDLDAYLTDPAAVPVLEWIGEGRWRKARDAAKELTKKDRARYLPLLVESNVGLVREMIAKGLAKEAGTVVDYLQSIAPAELVAALRAEIAAPRVEPGKAVVAGEGARWWAVTLRVAGQEEISAADMAAVDLLVTDGFSPEAVDGEVAAAGLAAELTAVRSALAATGDGRWEEAREALRGLPRQSVFRYWRLFLRGMRCIFDEDLETARQCFGELPTNGSLAIAARVLDHGGPQHGPVAPASARVPFHLACTGEPTAWGAPILASITSWKAGKRVKAFEDLLKGLGGAFPANRPGLAAVLTDAVLPYSQRMEESDVDTSIELIDRYGPRPSKKSKLSPEGLLAAMRPAYVESAGSVPAADLEWGWSMVLDRWTRCEGPDAQRETMAWQWLGEQFDREPDSFGGFGRFGRDDNDNDNDEDEDEDEHSYAIRALKKSVAADPENQKAWQALLKRTLSGGDLKDYHRLLEDLVKRFPRNKTFLTLAGENALMRRSSGEALSTLRAALALDPLDRGVKDILAVALVQQIRELLRKRRALADQWAELEALLEDRPPAEFLMLSRWRARVRRAVLDPDPAAAQAAAADAQRLAPTPIERLFFEEAIVEAYGLKERKTFNREWRDAMRSSAPGWAALTGLFESLFYLNKTVGWESAKAVHADARVLAVLSQHTKTYLKEDPDGVLKFIDFLNAQPQGMPRPLMAVVSLCLRELVRAFGTSATPRKRKVDPRLRLANLILSHASASLLFSPMDKLLKDLKVVADDAAALGLTAAVARAEALRHAIENPPASNFSAFNSDDDDEWDDDDDDFWDGVFGDEGDADEYSAEEDRILASLDQAALSKALSNFVEAFITNNMRKMKAARKCLSDLGVPEETINKLCAPPSGPKKKKPSSGGKNKPASGGSGPKPFQPDLFPDL